MSSHTDVDLIDLVFLNPNDQCAWREIVNRVTPTLRRASRHGENDADRDDLLQEGLIALHARLTKCAPEDRESVARGGLRGFAKYRVRPTALRVIERRRAAAAGITTRELTPADRLQRLASAGIEFAAACADVGVDMRRGVELVEAYRTMPTGVAHASIDDEAFTSPSEQASAEDDYLGSTACAASVLLGVLTSDEVQTLVELSDGEVTADEVRVDLQRIRRKLKRAYPERAEVVALVVSGVAA